MMEGGFQPLDRAQRVLPWHDTVARARLGWTWVDCVDLVDLAVLEIGRNVETRGRG